MNNKSMFMNSWNATINNHISTINKVIDELRLISHEYSQSKQEVDEIGFNVFKLSSDLYYRENFHSDIIKAFLDPLEQHNEGNKYLDIFVKILGLNPLDYKYSTVKREDNNIDILITNDNSKKAIIIENKINNAGDMPRQLPRYFDIIKEIYNVEAIVYIPLNSAKYPDKATWTEQDIENVTPLLKTIPAYCKSNKINIVDSWLAPSIAVTGNIDNISILRQYSKLIKHLNTSTMDNVILEKFYNTLKNEGELSTAISIRNMLNDLPEYLAIRIENKYKVNHHPFKGVFRYKSVDALLYGCKIDKYEFKIDVWCAVDSYTVYFWEQNKRDDIDIKSYFADIDLLKDFDMKNGNKYEVVKSFKPFEEDKVFEFIDQMRVELEKYKTK